MILSEVFLHHFLKPSRAGTVLSTDGTRAIAPPKNGGKKINQTKRKRTARITSPPKKIKLI